MFWYWTGSGDRGGGRGDIVGSDFYDIPTRAKWHNGSMGLAGEAAHAATPRHRHRLSGRICCRGCGQCEERSERAGPVGGDDRELAVHSGTRR